VCVYLGLIASRVGALVALLAEVIPKQQFVVPRPLRAISATPSDGYKLRIPLVERRILEDEQDVRRNPEMQTANGKQYAFGLLSTRAPILFEASGECLFLLGWLELRQQEGMAYADLVAVKRIHDILR